MVLDVTAFITEYDMWDFAHSAFEGGPTAGADTWRAAMECPLMLATLDNAEEIRDWLRGFGAWDRDEIDGWSLRELNALLLQFISGDYRAIEELSAHDASESIGRLWCHGGAWEFCIGD